MHLLHAPVTCTCYVAIVSKNLGGFIKLKNPICYRGFAGNEEVMNSETVSGLTRFKIATAQSKVLHNYQVYIAICV